MWSGCDPGWSGGDPGSSLAHPAWSGTVRGDPGWSFAGPGLGPDVLKCLIQPALATDWLPDEPAGARPGLIRVVRESSRTQPGSQGLVRGSSVECWSRTSHGLAQDEHRTTPGWLSDYSRMSPGIPGRVTDEHGWPTHEHGLALDDPGLAPE